MLDPEVLSLAAALMRAAPDLAADLEVARAVGWLHWYRFQVLLPEGGQEDFATALRLLEVVHCALPDAVPDVVRQYFDVNASAAPNETDAMAAEALAMLKIALRTGAEDDLSRCIELLRQVLDINPDGHSGRAGG